MGFAGETTDQSGFQPCAPADQNFQTFYAAASSAVWAAEWTFVGADHMDFLDNPNCGLTCTLCTQGSADTTLVRQALWTLEVAFFRLHLIGDSTQRSLPDRQLPPHRSHCPVEAVGSVQSEATSRQTSLCDGLVCEREAASLPFCPPLPRPPRVSWSQAQPKMR